MEKELKENPSASLVPLKSEHQESRKFSVVLKLLHAKDFINQ
jgi:hypothetical protein